MASALERLRAFARGAAAPLSGVERSIVAETGLPIVSGPVRDPLHVAVQAPLLPLAERGDVAGLAAAFDHLFTAKSFTGSGYRTYRIAHELMLLPAGDDHTANFAICADRWQRDRTDPVAASIYAAALLAEGCAADRDDANMGDLRAACGQARRVLAFAGPRSRRHWIWRQADFKLTFAAWVAGIEDEDLLLPAFAAVQTLDPHEFGIYDERAGQLLPRWTGDVTAVDRFARAAADRTAAQFGDLLYARIYDVVLSHEDPASTSVDPARLLAAFADWYERFPGQPLANRYAAHAHACGDLATLEHLFRGPLREIHPAHWFDRDQPLDAWRSIASVRRAGLT